MTGLILVLYWQGLRWMDNIYTAYSRHNMQNMHNIGYITAPEEEIVLLTVLAKSPHSLQPAHFGD